MIAGSFVLPVVSYAPAGERLLAESHLAPYVTVGADLAAALVPEELAEEYRARMDTVRGYWEERAAGGAWQAAAGPRACRPARGSGARTAVAVSVPQLCRFGLAGAAERGREGAPCFDSGWAGSSGTFAPVRSRRLRCRRCRACRPPK